MSSIFQNLFSAFFAKAKFQATIKSTYYGRLSFNPAPSFWALIPVRTYVTVDRKSREQMVSQFINKNKQL